jgi:hypothetical protein
MKQPKTMCRYFEKILFPNLDRSRRRYETNILLAALSVSLAMGGVIATLIFYYNSNTHNH